MVLSALTGSHQRWLKWQKVCWQMWEYRNCRLYNKTNKEQYAKERFQLQCLAHHKVEASGCIRAYNTGYRYYQQRECPQRDQEPVRRSVWHTKGDNNDIRS